MSIYFFSFHIRILQLSLFFGINGGRSLQNKKTEDDSLSISKGQSLPILLA